jgi:hypothetical protein
MSEIKRTNETESYNTTVGWLDDFLKKMADNAPPAPPTAFAAKEKFATIEDKMDDIKARVGFGNIERITKESSSEITSKSAKSCDCKKSGKKCNCGKENKSSERIFKLKNILKYISDMINEEPHLLEPEIIARCMENKDLGYESVKIKPSKIKNFIKTKKGSEPQLVEVVYMGPGIKEVVSPEEDMADYYRHSMPNIF